MPVRRRLVQARRSYYGDGRLSPRPGGGDSEAGRRQRQLASRLPAWPRRKMPPPRAMPLHPRPCQGPVSGGAVAAGRWCVGRWSGAGLGWSLRNLATATRSTTKMLRVGVMLLLLVAAEAGYSTDALRDEIKSLPGAVPLARVGGGTTRRIPQGHRTSNSACSRALSQWPATEAVRYSIGAQDVRRSHVRANGIGIKEAGRQVRRG